MLEEMAGGSLLCMMKTGERKRRGVVVATIIYNDPV